MELANTGNDLLDRSDEEANVQREKACPRVQRIEQSLTNRQKADLTPFGGPELIGSPKIKLPAPVSPYSENNVASE